MLSMRATWEFAHRLQDAGYAVLPLEPGGKKPILPGWQRTRSSHFLIDQWWDYCPAANLGIHTGLSGIAVADCDSDIAAEWVANNLPESPMFQHTPRGGLHVFYADPERSVPNRLNVMGIKLDIRADEPGRRLPVPLRARDMAASWSVPPG